ncbi:MAG: helicase-exonuclease AddAB subunit AddA [Lachnospiraceae bacterium]
MADLKLTTEQQQVVDARECSLLVAAAAGSGKTAVLVQRIIKKVMDTEHPTDIDRLLIVTFTNAAASEMRERIGAALEAALMEHPDSTHLQRQMMLLHSAQITTIHSFCLSVIREHFHLLHLDPGFRIAEEAELSLLESDVLSELFEERYEQADAAFLSLVECYGNPKSDKVLEDYVKKLYHYAVSQPWPEAWLSEIREGFSLSEQEFREHPLMLLILGEVKRALKDALVLQKKMLRLTEEPDGPALYRDCFLQDGELLENLSTAVERGYEELAKSLFENDFTRLPSKKQEADEEKKERAKALRAEVKDIVAKIKKDFFYEPLPEMYQELHAMEEPVGALIQLTLDFMERLSDAKEEKNLLDFSDLEQFALKVLVANEDGKPVPTEAARMLAERYDEIMIDEYQDSNLVQEYILGSISGEWDGHPNLFMVGDVKQSIYRFRMARPQLFVEKYDRYDYEETSAHRKIDLNKNFRSRSSVLESVNRLFAGLMHKESTEVEYDAKARLNYGGLYEADEAYHRTELLFVRAGEEAEQTASPEASETDEERTAVQTEALAVAMRIKELVSQEMPVSAKKESRPVRYEDIVILLRTMAGWSETFLEVLTEQGIPAYADTSAGYFRAMEVQKTLSFLKILDNPKQDIPFAAVLHSPIADFSAEELAELRIRYGVISGQEKKQRTLYEAARLAYLDMEKNGSEGGASEGGAETENLRQKLKAFFGLYDRLKEEAKYISIHELLEHFYAYSGYYDTVSVMPGGERRRGNLDMLVAKAKQYETTSYSGLYDFLRYMERLVKYEVDFGEAKAESSGNMVRIMSIHKSKGLEFPVVFVCGMEKKLNCMDMRDKLIFHPELGIGADFVDTELRIKGPTLFKKALVRKLTQEMISEELRVLYVAMTRAKEKLILTGTVKKFEERISAWQERAMTRDIGGLLSVHVLGATTYFDFVCPMIFGQPGAEEYFVFREVKNEQLTAAGVERSRTTEQLLTELEMIEEAEEDNSEISLKLRFLLESRENYCYPFKKEAELPMKVTVSELKRLSLILEEEERQAAEEQEEQERTATVSSVLPEEMPEKAECQEDVSYPDFLKPEEKLSGSDRGTVYHRVLELLPMEKSYTAALLSKELQVLKEAGKIKEEELAVISERKLLTFFSSPLAGRMRTAEEAGLLYREQPFVLGIPARELYPEADTSEPVLVQGIMDAFFVENGEIVLLDYKTDYVKQDAKEELTKKYRTQLCYYKRALEQLYGLPVKEMRIYSFSGDCDFEV